MTPCVGVTAASERGADKRIIDTGAPDAGRRSTTKVTVKSTVLPGDDRTLTTDIVSWLSAFAPGLKPGVVIPGWLLPGRPITGWPIPDGLPELVLPLPELVFPLPSLELPDPVVPPLELPEPLGSTLTFPAATVTLMQFVEGEDPQSGWFAGSEYAGAMKVSCKGPLPPERMFDVERSG